MKECPQCKGNGEYAVTATRSLITGEYVDLIECPLCNGTGEVDALTLEAYMDDERAEADYQYEKENG